MMTEISSSRIIFAAAFSMALGFALFLHGAVPFMAVPTLLQAVWTTGFSQSFVNADSLISLYANNIGAPEPAAIAFGLAGAFPAALFIALGLHAADAYAAMVAFWLSVAFISAWYLGMKLGRRPYASLLGALVWITLPVIWVHASHSMLSLGIALLPFYFLVSYSIFFESSHNSNSIFKSIFYISACIIAVFMDGYTFMMFATGSSLLGLYAYFSRPDCRRSFLFFSFPLHVSSFLIAYILYITYIDKSGFAGASLDFFRGWGVDISFFVIPTKGILWLGDALDISVSRTRTEHFGAGPVWTTTFFAPLFLAGLLSWFFTRKTCKISSAFLIVGLIGLYLSLGPSLKFFSDRPDAMIEAGQLNPLMPAKLAVMPTGTAWIWEYLPGFENMRAVYRWSALAMFGFWCLFMLWFLRENSIILRKIVWILAIIILLFNIPNLSKSWNTYVNFRDKFYSIDDILVKNMSEDLESGEKVVFLPFRNDFLVNYLAPKLNITTYNIGGDKNLRSARDNWPELVRKFRIRKIDSGFAKRTSMLLTKCYADAAILPFIDMQHALHRWPPERVYKKQIESVLAELQSMKYLSIDRREFYAVVRVAPDWKERTSCNPTEDEVKVSDYRPAAVGKGDRLSFSQGQSGVEYLGSGWSQPEQWGVWSEGNGATLILPLKEGNVTNLVIQAKALLNSSHREQKVIIDINGKRVNSVILTLEDNDKFSVNISNIVMSKLNNENVLNISFKLPDAVRPIDIGINQDRRVLGIGLRSISIQ